MKTAVGVLYLYFAFLVWYFPRFILLAARAITGPNIVTTSFSLYRHALMFFNSSLNPAIFGWRMRQIRHAILDTQRKVYTYRKPWFWTVRAIFILQSTVLFQVQERHFLAFSFSFNVGWNETLNSVNWKVPIQGSVPFGTSSRWKLHPILAPFARYQSGSVLFIGSVKFWMS